MLLPSVTVQSQQVVPKRKPFSSSPSPSAVTVAPGPPGHDGGAPRLLSLLIVVHFIAGAGATSGICLVTFQLRQHDQLSQTF